MNKFIFKKKKIPIFFILGHTASGKTKTIFNLKDLFPIDIINADSKLVFREMNIGTCKPSNDELIKYPHKIVNIRDPIQKYSVLDFCKDSLISINESILNKKIPIFVGGSMFYINTLINGINLYSNLFINKLIKDNLYNIEFDNIIKTYNKLNNKINNNINNYKNIYKYIENYFTIKNKNNFKGLFLNDKYSLYQIAILNNNKYNLNKKIKFRFYDILNKGFENEVIKLFTRKDLNINMQSIKSIGYKQMWNYINNKISYNNMIKYSIKSTIELSRKQINWIKNWKFNLVKFNTNDRYINNIILYIYNIIKNYNYNI